MVYRAKLHARIAAACNTAPTLESLCRACEGAFPSVIMRVARETGIPSIPGPATSSVGDDCQQPEPHPVDYDWRFTPESSNRLADLALQLGQQVACLGTPTVFCTLLNGGHSARTLLWDHNHLWSRVLGDSVRFKVAPIDSARVVGRDKHGFDVVVMDPPWYVEHYKTWLATACVLLRPGGHVIMPVFGPLLRPRGDRQRHELARFLREVGTSNWGVTSVEYETPPFERETLRAQGLPFLGNWRAAEVVCIKTERIPSARASNAASPRWSRFSVGRQVVMLRCDCPPSRELRLEPVGPTYGFVLRSVSARNSHRHRANLWTSRNRIFRVSGRRQIASFLNHFSETENWNLAARRARLSPAERCTLLPLREALESR